MKFYTGCNYWASNAGVNMWNEFDEKVIRRDLDTLTANGVVIMRVFPLWSDFQPVAPMLGYAAGLLELQMADGSPITNEYYLNDEKMSLFDKFCDICEEYGVKLIVGILTGWMSGGLFIPPVLYNRNLYSDPLALTLEQKYIKGIVGAFKNKKAIVAWDLGNECNCMFHASDKYEAVAWTGNIANAIKAADPARPVVSGMHSLSVDPNATWNIQDQGEHCDVLTTHPYPIFVPHANKDKYASFRTSLHGSTETKLYSDISGKPCFVEEIGNLGPMCSDEDTAADFFRINAFANAANGVNALLWWCSADQKNIDKYPYTRQQCEVELGLTTADGEPRAMLKEMGRVKSVFDSLDFELPKAQSDAVCVLTLDQDQWGVAYMANCLAKQAGLELDFAFINRPLPISDTYLMPSIKGTQVIPRDKYLELKQRVFEGATLYISYDNGFLEGFEELAGVRVTDYSMPESEVSNINFAGENIAFSRARRQEIKPCGAEVLAYDSTSNPAVTKHRYGKGTVYYVNFPLESMLLGKCNAFDEEYYKIYAEIFKEKIECHEARSKNKYIALTLHKDNDGIYCIALNHSDSEQPLELELGSGYNIDKVFYGSIDSLSPFEAAVFKISK